MSDPIFAARKALQASAGLRKIAVDEAPKTETPKTGADTGSSGSTFSNYFKDLNMYDLASVIGGGGLGALVGLVLGGGKGAAGGGLLGGLLGYMLLRSTGAELGKQNPEWVKQIDDWGMWRFNEKDPRHPTYKANERRSFESARANAAASMNPETAQSIYDAGADASSAFHPGDIKAARDYVMSVKGGPAAGLRKEVRKPKFGAWPQQMSQDEIEGVRPYDIRKDFPGAGLPSMLPEIKPAPKITPVNQNTPTPETAPVGPIVDPSQGEDAAQDVSTGVVQTNEGGPTMGSIKKKPSAEQIAKGMAELEKMRKNPPYNIKFNWDSPADFSNARYEFAAPSDAEYKLFKSVAPRTLRGQ